MKTCTKCDTSKELSEFSRNGKYLRNKCKTCTRPQINDWYADNRDHHLSNTSKYQKANPEVARASSARFRNKDIEAYRAYQRAYQKANPDKMCAYVAKHRANKLQATPAWLTKEQKADIAAMYTLAKKFEKLCNISYHVDHIVPLAGKDVRGLHVPWNLQILPASVNMSKGNRHNEEALRK